MAYFKPTIPKPPKPGRTAAPPRERRLPGGPAKVRAVHIPRAPRLPRGSGRRSSVPRHFGMGQPVYQAPFVLSEKPDRPDIRGGRSRGRPQFNEDHYNGSWPTAVFDVECYPNFFLILFKVVETGEIKRFQISPSQKLNRAALEETLKSHLLVGFNSYEYDAPMIQLALNDYSAAQLKKASDEIVLGRMRHRDFLDRHQISDPAWNHIDLLEVAPLDGGLKTYAGRLHCKKMQELPISPDAVVTAEQAKLLFEYCCNDLDNSILLFKELTEQLKLRAQLSLEYKQDLRSRSDAQVAEKIIGSEVKKLNGGQQLARASIPSGTSFKYNIPSYISYKLPQLQAMLEKVRAADFVVDENGHCAMPPELDGLVISISGCKYRMGIGGLHSSEESVSYVADGDYVLTDRDVASFYPKIILNDRLYPEHLGENFLTVYQSIVTRRLAAKKAGDKMTAEALKIAVNGSFGKLGNKYSILYAPQLLIQVTVTGQLALLMLIEAIEGAGIPVISANTDGVLSKCATDKYPLLSEVIAKWEAVTGFETEETKYCAVHSKDVNNYIAIKENGKIKGKGLYNNPWGTTYGTEGPAIFKLQKNPQTTIVIEALIALLRDGVPLEDTITQCKDITKFVAVRKVKGGAMYAGNYLGQTVRWYYSYGKGSIDYRTSGNKVPKSEGAKPLMQLPDEFPRDVNYNWYVLEAQGVLQDFGLDQVQGALF